MTRAMILRLSESYFRHRWLNLMPLLLMIAAAGAYAFLKPREYTTQGLIAVPGQSYLATLTNVVKDPASPWISPSQATANEIKEQLQTDSFIRSVIQRTDLAPGLSGDPNSVQRLIKDVREALSTTTQGDNQVQVAAVYPNPIVVYQIVSATIANYTQWRIDTNLTQSTVAQSFFADLVTSYAANVDVARQALNQYVLQHPSPLSGNRPDVELIEMNRLNAELDQSQARLTSALDKQESARLAASQATVDTRQSLYVQDEPTVPDQSTTSAKEIALQSALFIVVGIALTTVAIVGGALFDRSFWFPLDVTLNLNLPVLAVVPDMAPKSPRFRRQVKRGAAEADASPLPTRHFPFRYSTDASSASHDLPAPPLASEASQSDEQPEMKETHETTD